MTAEYLSFLQSKVRLAGSHGLPMAAGAVNPRLLGHQGFGVKWLVEGGRRALFGAFGLGKTVMQLEAVRLVVEAEASRGLIVCPLGVRQEFVRDALKLLGWSKPPKFIRSIEEAGTTGVYLDQLRDDSRGQARPRRVRGGGRARLHAQRWQPMLDAQ